MENINFEQLGVAAVTVVLLLLGINILLKKNEKLEDRLDVKDERIEELHAENTETLVKTLDSHNKAHSVLQQAMDFFTNGDKK